MALQMKPDDEIRLQILNALLEKGIVQPSIQRIKKKTGLHKATIKSSLKFLEDNQLIESYGPKVIFKKFGYSLEILELLQVDFSEKQAFMQFLEAVQKDPHVYMMAPMIGSGNLNLVIKHIHKNIESFHKHNVKNYYEKIPGLYKLIKDRQIFYIAAPDYKNKPRTDSIIKIIKSEKGIE
jgi:DNA-binding Lrp family transcriptional regulator